MFIIADMGNDENLSARNGKTLLAEALLRLLPQTEVRKTTISGFTIVRRNEATDIQRCFYKPNIILMLQGTKHVIVGSQEFIYGENQCMITGLDLPSAGRVSDATQERPSLILVLDLDEALLTELSAQIAMPVEESLEQGEQKEQSSVIVTETDPAVLEAFLRLTELLHTPEQQVVLSPMIIREIHYRMLIGPLGGRLRRIFTSGSKSNRIAQSIAWLRSNYTQVLNVSKLATQAHMAQSTFHRQFKQMTTLSPLQYQKRLRLFEAQRLMLVEKQDVARAAYAVGYESPTQFSREYKRMFGEPPRKDIMRALSVSLKNFTRAL